MDPNPLSQPSPPPELGGNPAQPSGGQPPNGVNAAPTPNLPPPQYPPAPAAPTQPADPFAFLKEQPKRKTLAVPRVGNTLPVRIAVVAGLLLVVVIAAALLKSALSHKSSLNLPSIIAVVSEQQELSNLSSTGSQETQNYANFSLTVLGSITTDQNKLSSLLSSNGIKIASNQIIAQPNVTNQLNQAQQDSNFDPVYSQVMQQQLQMYENELSNAYTQNKSTLLRSYLTKDYANAKLMLKMLNSPDA